MKKSEKSVSQPGKNLESRWTKVNGLLIHSRVSLHPSEPTLPPIILVHGLGVSSRYMIPLAELLAAECSVYAVDLPGFGRSDKTRRILNITELADALAAWMREIGINRAVLLANSIGCQVVIGLSMRHPSLAERIVLVSPTVDSHARTVFKQFFHLLLDLPREPVSLLFIALLDYLQAGLGRVAETFGYALEDRLEENLPRVNQPALVVRGQRDPLVSQRWAEKVTGLLPLSRLVVIPKAAHGVNYNSPEHLAVSVREFLETPFDEILIA